MEQRGRYGTLIQNLVNPVGLQERRGLTTTFHNKFPQLLHSNFAELFCENLMDICNHDTSCFLNSYVLYLFREMIKSALSFPIILSFQKPR